MTNNLIFDEKVEANEIENLQQQLYRYAEDFHNLTQMQKGLEPLLDKPISLLMNTTITAVDFNDTIEKVEYIMALHKIPYLPVIDSNQSCFGVISYSDIVRFHHTGKNPKVERAWELCAREIIEVNPDTSIRETTDLMLKHKVEHILITENQLIQGFISSVDLLAGYLKLSKRL